MALRRSLNLMRCQFLCTNIKAQIVGSKKTSKIVDRINAEVASKNKLLFAVVYLNQRQYKICENDLITIHHHVPLDIGDKIKLEKVLMVGGKNFSLFGRPLLNSSNVRINATVVEKTTTYPELNYVQVDHKNIRKLLWFSTELTVLRINEIIFNDLQT
ncbi:unnamed protein product [Dracunculus medinensis]|uniref:Large ribosomal subunit protein bL21m n=1 Tax=Dracunculus medinensis TaxID=318479 RepID=A0A0N4U7V0_DRAME|nr:unnamed protein product [Dracunculus medinensis]